MKDSILDGIDTILNIPDTIYQKCDAVKNRETRKTKANIGEFVTLLLYQLVPLKL